MARIDTECDATRLQSGAQFPALSRLISLRGSGGSITAGSFGGGFDGFPSGQSLYSPTEVPSLRRRDMGLKVREHPEVKMAENQPDYQDGDAT